MKFQKFYIGETNESRPKFSITLLLYVSSLLFTTSILYFPFLKIHIWSRRDSTVITSLPSCGGFVYSLDVSVLDPARLAVGVGDNVIRVWDTTTQGSSYSVTNLWRGIGTKVMKVLYDWVALTVMFLPIELCSSHCNRRYFGIQ